MSKLNRCKHQAKVLEGFCPHAKEKIYFCSECKEPVEVKKINKEVG